MFKNGELIRCICLNFQSGDDLTLDKWYKSRGMSTHLHKFVVVRNDEGLDVAYPCRLFISLTELRKRKIKKICSKLEIE